MREENHTRHMGDFDDIVAGQGLAGTLLALALEKRGRRVLVVDPGHVGAASLVATGLLNPVTGMRLSPTAGSETLIPTAIATFREIESCLGVAFFHEAPLFRAYENEAERTLKARREREPGSAHWFGPDLAPGEAHPGVNDPLGGFMILGGGRVDLPVLLAAARAHFAAEGRLVVGRVSPAEVVPGRDGVRWRDRAAKRFFFCEGAAVRANPWFSDLAWQPAKGEFITVETRGFTGPDFAVKRGVWAIPLGGGRWRVGSNYEWEKLDETPTEAVRETLLAGFAKAFRGAGDLAVSDHRAGIRPAAKGSRPVVGPHPKHPALWVFNGFGAKGCTWAPHYAEAVAGM